MNETLWLKLSGLMRRCIYDSENPQCPFIDYRNQDYIQHEQTLTSISHSKAQKLLVSCNNCRHQCKLARSKVEAIYNPNNFRIID